MANVVAAASVILGAPGIEHVNGQVFLNPHIMNVGESPLSNLQITAITFGGARRISPAGFPLMVNLIGAGGSAHITARFSSGALTVGAKYLLSVSGRYTVEGTAYGLTLNRYVQLPAESAPALPSLKARLESSPSTNYWNYALFNDEPPASAQFIAAFSLAVAAPVAVTGTPDGWMVETDNISYVLWHAADYVPPYPHQIAPGRTLAGFQLMSPRTRSEASAAVLTSWNHASDQAGLVVSDYAMTPFRFA